MATNQACTFTLLLLSLCAPACVTMNPGPRAGGRRPGGDLIAGDDGARLALRRRLSLPRFGQPGRVAFFAPAAKATLIFMFTTWSLRSQMEAPQFVQLHERAAKRGLRVLGVVLDSKTAKTMIQTYIDFVGMQFEVVQAEPNDLDLVAAFGRTRRVPRSLLLDRAGNILLDAQGITDFGKLHLALERLLGRGE